MANSKLRKGKYACYFVIGIRKVIMDKYIKDFNIKLSQVRFILENKELGGILITKQCNFSWMTHGRAYIGMATEAACANILVTKDSVYLISSKIEKERLLVEELTNIKECIEAIEYPWFEDDKKSTAINNLLKGNTLMTDVELEEEFVELRSTLLELDIELLRILSAQTAQMVEETCKEISKGMSENEIAGLISQKLWEKGIEPVTLLIACDERISHYRHPIPTSNTLNQYAMVAVNTRKWGLFSSVTRFVSLTKPTEEIKDKFKALAKIEAAYINQTRPGAVVGDIIKNIISYYEALGYGEEWKLHHQGGLTGYLSREYRATTKSKEIVQSNQAFAWNPSITGSKAEDTLLIGKDKNEVLTYTGEYVYIDVHINGEVYPIPTVLVRNEY